MQTSHPTQHGPISFFAASTKQQSNTELLGTPLLTTLPACPVAQLTWHPCQVNLCGKSEEWQP